MFLASENFHRPSVLFLRNHGYEVISIQESFPGISDIEVIQKAPNLDLVILTFDRDYGELIFRHAKANPPVIVYFREKGSSPVSAGEVLVSLLHKEELKFENAFSVVEGKSVRQRFYSR